MAASHPREAMGFVETLSKATAAARTLVNLLQADRSLSSFRLVCRDLRSYVDENVTNVRVVANSRHTQEWAARELSPLSLWPSCSSIELLTFPTDVADLVVLASILFSGLPLERRKRIHTLSFVYVETPLPDQSAWQAEAAVSSVAALLPSLCKLELAGLTQMSYDPVRQQLMCDGVASLRYLDELTLHSCRTLDRVGTLAGSRLRVLKVLTGLSSQDGVVSQQAAAGIAQLRSLKQLYIVSNIHLAAIGDEGGAGGAGNGDAVDGTWRVLLNNLPPRLEFFLVAARRAAHVAINGACVSLIDGYATVMIVSRGVYAANQSISAFAPAAAALLASRAMGPQLENLRFVSALTLDGVGETALDAPELRPLWALLRRCSWVNVRELQGASADSVVQAVARLSKPGRVVLRAAQGDLTLTLRRQAEDQKPWILVLCQQADGSRGPAAARNTGGGAPGQTPQQPEQAGAQPLPLPAACDEVVPLASLQCLAAARLIRSNPCAAAAAPHALEGCGSGSSGPAVAAASPVPQLLLLQGPFMDVLAKAPEALQAWLRWLAQQAGPEEVSADAIGAGSRHRIVSYQVLPGAGAVLVECSDVEGAADAVAAAATSAAAQKQDAAVVLSVLPASMEEADVTEPREAGAARRAVLTALQQVLQATWDESLGACGGMPAAELALLRRVLSAWEQLAAELPPEVRM